MFNWHNIPYELRQRNQWCIAGPNKEPLTMNCVELINARVNEPSTWMSFELAATIAHKHNLDIGYVLHEDDPYACIDFDIKDIQNAPDRPDKWTTVEDLNFFNFAMKKFDSYTERSKSGRGFHTWVKGLIGKGIKGQGIEVYSQERFIICTGNVTHLSPIQNRDIALVEFVQHIRPNGGGAQIELEEVEPEFGSWYLYELAMRADNADKFALLWDGRWEEMGYPSQSEADLALLSILAFYSKSNALIRETFRISLLGKRQKAMKNDDYINRTLKTIRSRQAEEDSVNLSAMEESADLLRMVNERKIQQEINRIEGNTTPRVIHPLQSELQPIPVPGIPIVGSQFAAAAPMTEEAYHAGAEGIPWPPNAAGHLARFIYSSNYLSVKEVAIVATIGLLAGLCGKAWYIPKSGLNMYNILIARSGIGKEGLHAGIASIIKSVTEQFPLFGNFFDYSDIASGPALTKACVTRPSFLNIQGEFGKKLRRMANDVVGPMATYRTELTNLYQKSSPDSGQVGLTYSDASKNVLAPSGVAYSLIGETTPGTFYQSLTNDMVEDGFISRFLCIEYAGDRPKANENILTKPDGFLIDVLARMGIFADRVVKNLETPRLVDRDEYARRLIKLFDEECRDKINTSTDDFYRQMYNRASLKAQRVAALFSVLDEYERPIIKKEHIEWSIDVIRRDIGIMQRHSEEGDVGIDENSREKKIYKILSGYLEKDLATTYADHQKFKDAGVVTYSYIQQHVGTLAAFKDSREGTRLALASTLKTLTDSGCLFEISKAELVKQLKFNGQAFKILKLPTYGAR